MKFVRFETENCVICKKPVPPNEGVTGGHVIAKTFGKPDKETEIEILACFCGNAHSDRLSIDGNGCYGLWTEEMGVRMEGARETIVFNLDDEQECEQLITEFDNRDISILEKKYQIRYGVLIELVNYAVERKTAFQLRKDGLISLASKAERKCEEMYQALPDEVKW